MDDQQALRIVGSLANGVDPETGEVFPANSPYQRPATIRALFRAQRILEETVMLAATAAAQGNQQGNQQVNRQGLPTQQSDPQRRREGGDAQRRTNPAMANAGKPWSAEEDSQLLARFDADTALPEIARAHGRTVGGVRARLEKHGRLEPSTATRWPSSTKTQASPSANQSPT